MFHCPCRWRNMVCMMILCLPYAKTVKKMPGVNFHAVTCLAVNGQICFVALVGCEKSLKSPKLCFWPRTILVFLALNSAEIRFRDRAYIIVRRCTVNLSSDPGTCHGLAWRVGLRG